MSDRKTAPATAVEMAARQREISVSEFFLKNRHLLGFDTPAKALVTAVKEAVDNALDACEEAGILPDITVEVRDRFGKSRVVVEDNGPGIVESQIAPSGVELGRLIQMLGSTKSHSLLQFLIDEFSCVGRKTALEIIKRAGKPLSERSYPTHIAHAQAGALHHAIQKTRVQAPRTDCIVPIGEAQLLEGLRKEVRANFYSVATRPVATYRGNPFQVEVGIAYGRPGPPEIEIDAGGHMHKRNDKELNAAEQFIARQDEPVRLLRFANRVPLLYQQSSCAITKAAIQTNWRIYGLRQSKGALPVAPMAILVHVASVWVPYTSESKEAIEPYPEILKEIKLALRDCARRLAHYLRHELHLRQEYDRRSYIEKYLPHIGLALQDILALSDDQRDAAMTKLDDILHMSRAAERRDR